MNEAAQGPVLQIILFVVTGVLSIIFGRPIVDAWSKRRTKQEGAGAAQADASSAQAALEAADFRASDTVLDRWAARLERAEKSRDEALALVQLARNDVHDVRNAAMKEMNAVRQSAQAEIERIQHAAETRMAVAEKRIEELMDQVRERDATIVALTTRVEQFIHENERLNSLLTHRMNAAGFDPTKTKEL